VSALAQPRVRALLAAVLALLVVAGLVAGALLGRRVLAERSSAAAGEDAVAAATQLAVNFTTLDYRTFDRDAQRVLDDATGTFKKEFAAQTDQLQKLVTTNKAVSQGKVIKPGLVSHDADTARVLLVVDADVTNTSATTPVARHYRMQVDLTRSGDQWLTDQLQFVG
jgi:Mce-associated membrane protein